ncbi:MAG TPA: response regulator [Acidimicrobiales bacterium]|nr:response regulator [Acidimicrobiales bacterium]
MSGLQDFLAPFSHLLFANRDKAIVVLGILLGWFTIQLLIARWRNERLQRDLAAAKSGASASSGRRYAPSHQVEEAPVESGALPPVKGGRTYARNLGNALSKAGISSSQQIYSPPSPQGWAPSSNAGQAGMGQPPQGAPYAPPNTPWGAPAPQQQAPWAYPSGPGRPPQSPGQVPFYQPQAPQPQQQPAPMPPMNTPQSAPGFFGPPGVPAFSHPAFAPATSGPAAAPAPPAAQPAPPMGPPMVPPFANQPAPPTPAPEPAASDGGRRGKPKRRRFNFNVLENLEKIVQAKSEPLPPTGWTPPAAAPAAPVAPAFQVPSIGAPPELKSVPPATTAPEVVSPVKEAPTEALPLPFGPSVEDAPNAIEPESPVEEQVEEPTHAEQPEDQAVATEMEAPVAATEGDEETTAVEDETPVAEVEPETPPAEPTPEPRKSMRDMLFGEESHPAAEAKPAAASADAEPEAESADWSWRPTRWEPTEEAAWTPDNGTAAPEPAVVEPVAEDTAPVEDASTAAPVEDAPAAEPVVEAVEAEPFAPWKSSFASESAIESEPAKSDAGEAAAVGYPDSPSSDSSGGNAGTVVIIEDDETAANYYATLFRGNGYRVEVANDGVSGVDLCTRVQPQVILLDVMMPRQNGILVLQTLRASDETKNTPVVVMSNFSEPTLIKRAIQLGALEYVIKTQVEGSALLTAMPRWINREKAFAAA